LSICCGFWSSDTIGACWSNGRTVSNNANIPILSENEWILKCIKRTIVGVGEDGWVWMWQYYIFLSNTHPRPQDSQSFIYFSALFRWILLFIRIQFILHTFKMGMNSDFLTSCYASVSSSSM
jgi:hypothetical protein